MPIQLHGLRLPTANVPSSGGLRTRFTAFTGRIASTLRSIGHRVSEAVRSLTSRSVSVPNPPPSPIQQLRQANRQGGPGIPLGQQLAAFDQANLRHVQTTIADPIAPLRTEAASSRVQHAKFRDVTNELTSGAPSLRHVDLKAEREQALQADLTSKQVQDKKELNDAITSFEKGALNHVEPQNSDGVSRRDALEFELARPMDNMALRPQALNPALEKAALVPEPGFGEIKPLLMTRWGEEQKALTKQLGTKLSQLKQCEKRGQKEDATRLRNEIDGLGQQLGTFIGKMCTNKRPEFQQALALGTGGPLKSEIWQLLRGVEKTLPDWTYAGLESETQSEFEGSADRSMAKRFLDNVYNKVLAELEPRSSSEIPPNEITFKGESYHASKVLGRGGQGVATLYTNDRGESIVLKTLLNPEIGFMLASEVESARNEYKVHLALAGPSTPAHPNILGIHGVLRAENGLPMAILDLAPRGSVKGLLGQRLPDVLSRGAITPQAAHLVRLTLLRESIEGMIEMQERYGARHGDFKPDNLLIGADGHIKLADFGLTTLEPNDSKEGTPAYQAPEHYLFGTTLTPKADTWAIGSFAHELLRGERPLKDNDEKTLRAYANEGDLAAARTFITRLAENFDAQDNAQGVTSADRLFNAMLHPDPQKRPALSEVLRSSLFDDLGRGGDDLSPKVRELIQAITADPVDDALVKARSDALGV